MIGIVRLGDITSGGGVVLTASRTRTIMGKGLARIGDKVSCPLHGENTIIEGNEKIKDEGKAIAFNGHRLACGCKLISSLSHVGII
ncbi:PAAR domain-containing protein [Enterobacteriaceae bacterium YMB-R22]|uniref:PAAR domain-containing protein n=1 Tax=Tenebrionicola larvae TaxID=2815733 RepID=UPI00201120C7|nr:PAAR domain-containing protein [Tenebrionicola larvae]MBV4413279.1 PAAR domain-containing protein [Tenebrionicola larvae]